MSKGNCGRVLFSNILREFSVEGLGARTDPALHPSLCFQPYFSNLPGGLDQPHYHAVPQFTFSPSGSNDSYLPHRDVVRLCSSAPSFFPIFSVCPALRSRARKRTKNVYHVNGGHSPWKPCFLARRCYLAVNTYNLVCGNKK